MGSKQANDKWVLGEPKKFFISFKELGGHDLANSLYDYLKGCHVDVFISDRNLQYDMNQGTWREQIDRALEVTNVFILIITPTASRSSEVIREFKQVINRNDVKKYILIHEKLWSDQNQTTIQLTNDERVNLKTFHAVKFENRDDLVRNVYSAVPIIAKIEFKEN